MINDSNYQKALTFTEKHEGMMSADKYDPGGMTKYGISQKGLGVANDLVDVTGDQSRMVKVEDLTLEDAFTYYYTYYWVGSGCGSLDLPLSVVVFDASVNCGVHRSTAWLEQNSDPKWLIDTRRLYYLNLITAKPDLAKFKNGWLNRLNDLSKYVDILTQEQTG